MRTSMKTNTILNEHFLKNIVLVYVGMVCYYF